MQKLLGINKYRDRTGINVTLRAGGANGEKRSTQGDRRSDILDPPRDKCCERKAVLMISNGRPGTKDRNKFSAVDNARARGASSASPLISWRLRSPMLISERCITALRETYECRRSFIGSPSDTGVSSGRNLVCVSGRIMLILPHIRDKRRCLCYEPKARKK